MIDMGDYHFLGFDSRKCIKCEVEIDLELYDDYEALTLQGDSHTTFNICRECFSIASDDLEMSVSFKDGNVEKFEKLKSLEAQGYQRIEALRIMSGLSPIVFEQLLPNPPSKGNRRGRKPRDD